MKPTFSSNILDGLFSGKVAASSLEIVNLLKEKSTIFKTASLIKPLPVCCLPSQYPKVAALEGPFLIFSMVKKTSDFDDFLVATILADIFEPSGSDNFDFVSRKIVEGLDAHGMIKRNDLDNGKELAA